MSIFFNLGSWGGGSSGRPDNLGKDARKKGFLRSCALFVTQFFPRFPPLSILPELPNRGFERPSGGCRIKTAEKSFRWAFTGTPPKQVKGEVAQLGTAISFFEGSFTLDCYIINLEHAQDRWKATSERFAALGLNVVRVPAIAGKDLEFPHPDFAAWRFFFGYGRRRVPNEVACFFSHIKALRTFLETGKAHAMICEDDVIPSPELMDVVNDAMQYSGSWDLLRLNGLRATRGTNFVTLSHGFQLCCDLKTASGAGAYIVNRNAAKTIIKKCLPMTLPYYVALYYSWPIGIREVTVQPFLVLLNETTYKNSTIGERTRYPLLHPASFRYFISLPYRVISRTARKISRIRQAVLSRFWTP